MTEPRWMSHARDAIGMCEVKGPKHNADVVALWKVGMAGDFTDDETPWCAAYVSAMLEKASVKSARTGWARGYLKWGIKSPRTVGAIVVFSRGPTSGHVGFIVGRNADGHIMVLGGNQGDKVKIAAFDPDRILDVRWPSNIDLPKSIYLPLLTSTGKLSTNEA